MEYRTKTITSSSKLINLVFDVAFTQRHHQRNTQKRRVRHELQKNIIRLCFSSKCLELVKIIFRSIFCSLEIENQFYQDNQILFISSTFHLLGMCVSIFFCFERCNKRVASISLSLCFSHFSFQSEYSASFNSSRILCEM